jgi:hypothetical protein
MNFFLFFSDFSLIIALITSVVRATPVSFALRVRFLFCVVVLGLAKSRCGEEIAQIGGTGSGRRSRLIFPSSLLVSSDV